MHYKKIITLILSLITVLPAFCVLKEKNIDNTLSILRVELTRYHQELQLQAEELQSQQMEMGRRLMDIYTRSSQNSLMLYSQKPEYIFDLTYACHEASVMYQQFQSESLPFRRFIENNTNEIARYDSLVNHLSGMTARMLSEQALTDRRVCLTLAVDIRRTLQENSAQLEQYITYYNKTEERLRNLNDYASLKYAEIQSNIFINGGDDYLTILKHLPDYFSDIKGALGDKYVSHQKKNISQWDYRKILMLFAIIIIYGIVSYILNLLFIRFLMPKRFKTESFMQCKRYIVFASSILTLSVILMVIRLIFSDHNFLIMASGLLIQYTWLLAVIFISLLLRLNSRQIGSALHIYTPLMIIAMVVISFRIVLIPNDLVNVIFPPVLLVFFFWQWNVIGRHKGNIPRSDIYFTYFTLFVFAISCISSMFGYTLLSVEILIWWIMQLTCILTITCISNWTKKWAHQRKFDEKPITSRWFYEFCNRVVLRVLAVGSIVLSIYWAADVFNMSNATWEIFNTKFIDSDKFTLSVYGICLVIILYFLFSYINMLVKELLTLHFEQSDYSTAASRNVLANNVVQIIVWGVWLLISLSVLNVNNTWLVVISGGLSTGVGFASKDILENIYYGVSLMAGRVKIGDLIECDGTRGVVSSISYTSTMLSIADGSVIAFQNSQLFTKNYKNLTKNNGYELDKLEVGIAYGCDISHVRELIINKVSQLECINHDKPVQVILDSFADSCILLKVLVWVPVMTHYANDGEILEAIYSVLNENNIEIPFPQMDIHQR